MENIGFSAVNELEPNNGGACDVPVFLSNPLAKVKGDDVEVVEGNDWETEND